MSEWIVDIQSMIPIGMIGERMVVARRDPMSSEVTVLCAPKTLTLNMGMSLGDDGAFMTSNASSAFQQSEINQFLQAMMDAGWKRGLRPAGFDPSAGELAAVNRHLEDLRKIAMMRVTTSVDIGSQVGTSAEMPPGGWPTMTEEPKKW